MFAKKPTPLPKSKNKPLLSLARDVYNSFKNTMSESAQIVEGKVYEFRFPADDGSLNQESEELESPKADQGTEYNRCTNLALGAPVPLNPIIQTAEGDNVSGS